MKTTLLFIFAVLLFGLAGCTHAPPPPKHMNVAGTIISIPREEFDAIVKEAVKKHKLGFRWCDIKDENTIELFMSDKPKRAHGAVAVYKKIDGKWQEVSFDENGWII